MTTNRSSSRVTIPTVDAVLEETSIGCGLHRWNLEGGAIEVTTDELRPVLQEAYDESMRDWPSLISWDDRYGWHVA